MKRGQVPAISVILVVILGISSLALVLPWTYNVVQKRKDMKNLDDVYNFFILLDETIRNIAKNGGEETLRLDVNGRLSVYPDTMIDPLNNSIVFSFSSKVSNIAEGGWIPLNTPNTGGVASLGIDEPSVLFGKASDYGDGIDIEYKLWYRTLVDTTGRGYRIDLKTSDGTFKSSNTGYIRIRNLGSSGDPITVTEINIII